MVQRNKIYYPASQIKTNLLSDKGQWMLESGEEYIGYYHQYIDGLTLTGAGYDASTSQKLIPYINKDIQPATLEYNNLQKEIRTFISPYFTFPIPKEKDYKSGNIVRYVLRRRNSFDVSDIIEIDELQFNLWKKSNGGIDSTLYNVVSISWKLTGPLHDIHLGADMIYGVADTNERMVILKDKEFPGIKDFLTDFTELSVYSEYVDDKIKKLFG